MFEIKIILVSKSESLLGIMMDQGEFEVKPNAWVPFTRLRVGLLFLTFDFIKYDASTT